MSVAVSSDAELHMPVAVCALCYSQNLHNGESRWRACHFVNLACIVDEMLLLLLLFFGLPGTWRS
jgi:hypothetical protein